LLAQSVNRGLRPLGVQLISGRSADPAIKSFLPARKTIAAAQRAGLEVGAYIDQVFAEPGASPALVEAMLKLAELGKPVDRVCEIGPGSGRFAVEVIAALAPSAYEIYEPARDWMPTLRKLQNVVVRHCDGRTLSETGDATVDLIHSQKLFTYLDFPVCVGYLGEMARVVRPGGVVAFDAVTEPCLDDETVRHWMNETTIYFPFPRDWTIEFLDRLGLELLGSHFTPLPPGRSELLVFRRREPTATA
jgi:SAM-dependent methyltransferase